MRSPTPISPRLASGIASGDRFDRALQVVAAIYDECALEPFGGHIMFLLRRILAADRFACGIDHPQGWLAPDHIDRWAFDEAHALIEAARRDSWNALDRASDEEAIR